MDNNLENELMTESSELSDKGYEEKVKGKPEYVDEIKDERNTIPEEQPINEIAVQERPETEKDKDDKDGKSNVEKTEKKKKRPASISLTDKSEQFKKIIDIALEYGKMESENKNLKNKNEILEGELTSLKDSLKEVEQANNQHVEEINQLKDELSHRNEVISIVKADNSKSFEEFKNSLSAELKVYFSDYKELKKMEMSDDVGLALQDTLEGIFKKLISKGIEI